MREYDKRKARDCKYYFSKLDYEILRPILIYKYEKEKMHREDELQEMIQNDQNLIGSIYGQIDNDIRMSIVSEDRRMQSAMDMQASRITAVVHQLAARELENSLRKDRKISMIRNSTNIHHGTSTVIRNRSKNSGSVQNPAFANKLAIR